MLKYSGQRGLETWRNIACNILRNVFLWRLLHAASIRYIEDWKKDATLPAILRTTCFSGGGYTLHHYEQRGPETWFQHRLQYCAQLVSVEVATCCTLRVMRTGNVVFNLLCNIEYSIFQWRWLHASTLRKTRTKNMVQHCPKFCAQHFSVDSLHAANIACNIVCSGGGYTLQTLSATKTGNMVPLLVPLLSPAPPPTPQRFSSCF